jgi:hypothetical protein
LAAGFLAAGFLGADFLAAVAGFLGADFLAAVAGFLAADFLAAVAGFLAAGFCGGFVDAAEEFISDEYTVRIGVLSVNAGARLSLVSASVLPLHVKGIRRYQPEFSQSFCEFVA